MKRMVKATSSSEKAELKSSSSSSSSVSPTRESGKYKGVRKRKWGKWVSEIRLPNSRERIWLGSYNSPEKAARAFDAALFCLRGHTAKFNFPESPPEIAGGMSLSPSEIQLAAARFANSAASEALPTPPSENYLQAESPCGSSVVSDGTVQTLEGISCRELIMQEEPFLYSLTSMGSGNFPTDYGIFPGFDELNNGFFAPPLDQFPGGVADYHGEDGVLAQDSFLWNF